MRTHYFCLLIVSICISGILSATNPSYQDMLELEQVAFLDCMFTDLHGQSKEITIPRGLIDNAIKYGLALNSSSLGMAPIHHGDLLLKLNIETLTLVPWTDTDSKTARVMCTIHRDEQTPHELDVRYFLEKTVQEAKDMGYEFIVGSALEFLLCHDQYNESYQLTPYDTTSYCAAENNPYATSLKRTLLNILLAQNIPVEKIHHAIAPGQYEISIKDGNALTIADQLIITKQTIRTLAHAHSLGVTFMPKPLQDHPGNGMHIHCSLWDQATHSNIFYDENDPAHLSPIAKHFIAGILQHIHEVIIIFNPTINAYKRMQPEKLISIPRITSEQAAHIEFHSADPLCCPYLAFALLLKLGLDGIKNKTPLPDGIESTLLPLSFNAAITNFEHSDFAKKIVGDIVHTEFLYHKKQEFVRYNSFVTNWELDAYFES